MRIATWNVESLIRLTPERAESFRQAMAKLDADIWVLTETWFDFGPGAGYSLVAQSSKADDLKAWPDRCWVSVWAKSSSASRSQVICSQPDRMACGRIEIPGQMDVVVVGTVLPWGNSDKLFPGVEGFCAAVDSQAVDWAPQQESPEPCAYLVAGDFNQSLPYVAPYGYRKGEIAINSVLKKHDLLCLTEKQVLPSGKPMIDHVCVSQKGLKMKSVPNVNIWETPLINEKPITDHVGVFVDLEVS